MGDGDGKGVEAGAVGTLSTVGGARFGQWGMGGVAGGELRLGNLPGGFDLGLVYLGDYTISDFRASGRQDPAMLPRDVYLRADQRYLTLRAGRIPLYIGNIRSVDGAEVIFIPVPRLRLGGFAGERNEIVTTLEGVRTNRYRGMAHGMSADGGYAGFDARVFFRGIYDEGLHTRQDIGGSLNWMIFQGLSVHGRAMGSMLLNELEEAEGGARANYGPLTLSGYYRWSDPSLLYFDTNDPWIVFASQPNWRAGGDLALRYLDGAFLLHAGGYHSSLVDYGVDAGVQYGDRSFIRADLSYARDSKIASSGGSNTTAAWLTGVGDIGNLRTVASLGYLDGTSPMTPLYSNGRALGLLTTADYNITDSLTVGPRFDGTTSDLPFRWSGVLFVRWSPEIGHSSRSSGHGMGSGEKREAEPDGGIQPRINFPHEMRVAGQEGHLPPMSVCTTCHTTWKNECSKCHSTGPSGRMQSIFPGEVLRPTGSYGLDDDHRAADFRTSGHGRLARTDGKYCQTCHGRSFSAPGEPKACNDCHSPSAIPATREHPAAWDSYHSRVARRDPTSCQTCHGQSFCSNCHTSRGVAGGASETATRSYHAAGWAGEHARQGSVSVLSCSRCHSAESASPQAGEGQGTSCIRCHQAVGNPHGDGMSGRLEQLKRVNPRLCEKCHPGGTH